MVGDHRLGLLHALHIILAFGARAEAHLVHPARDRLLRARRQSELIHMIAKRLGVADDGEIDVAPCAQGDAGELGGSLGQDRALLRVQLADRGVGDHHALTERFERALLAAAAEVVPEGGEPRQLGLRGRETLTMGVGLGRRRLQPLVDVGEAHVAGGLAFGRMTRGLARLLLAGEVGREFGELLVAGLPQSAQLEEDERAEAGGGVREQIAERIELLLNAQRRALLLLQSIAQDMKLVLEIGVCLFQARAILEQLHEALFFRAHAAALRPSLEKAELVDQMSRLEPMDQSRDTRGNLPTRSDGLARRSIPAIYLTACYGSSADPVHA